MTLELVRPLLKGAPERGFSEPNRWGTGELAESALRPELVVEVRYDKVEKHRIRHGTRFLRFRPDKDPARLHLGAGAPAPAPQRPDDRQPARVKPRAKTPTARCMPRRARRPSASRRRSIERDDGFVEVDAAVEAAPRARSAAGRAHERRAMRFVRGRVLDVGVRRRTRLPPPPGRAGATSVGHRRLAGAIEVCRRRGVRDAACCAHRGRRTRRSARSTPSSCTATTSACSASAAKARATPASTARR